MVLIIPFWIAHTRDLSVFLQPKRLWPVGTTKRPAGSKRCTVERQMPPPPITSPLSRHKTPPRGRGLKLNCDATDSDTDLWPRDQHNGCDPVTVPYSITGDCNQGIVSSRLGSCHLLSASAKNEVFTSACVPHLTPDGRGKAPAVDARNSYSMGRRIPGSWCPQNASPWHMRTASRTSMSVTGDASINFDWDVEPFLTILEHQPKSSTRGAIRYREPSANLSRPPSAKAGYYPRLMRFETFCPKPF